MQHQGKQLNQTLHALSAEKRSTIALLYAEELSTRDAALVMGCSTGAFRTRLTRARKKLQNIWNNKPAHWSVAKNKLFPHQVGFTCPPHDFDAAPSDFLRMSPETVGVHGRVLHLPDYVHELDQHLQNFH